MRINSVATVTFIVHNNGSQWFVYLGPNPLPGPSFSIFGRVTEGMEVVEAIEALAQPDQTLSEPVTIEDVTIVEA